MFTGAELAGLCREAAITALREDLQVRTYIPCWYMAWVLLCVPACCVVLPQHPCSLQTELELGYFSVSHTHL